MPELPEVETMKRGIAAVAGCRIARVERIPSPCRPISITPAPARFARRAERQKIEGVSRIGKRVVLELERGDRIVFEPRMTGLVLLADPPTREHLRFRLGLSGRGFSGGNRSGKGPRQLLYWDRRGLGSVRLFSPRQFAEALGPERLGPDALGLDAEALGARLSGSRRAIKVALLDQRAVAGIGNLYASECLHLARIHPERQCDALTSRHWERLAAALKEVLTAAIHYEGSTLGDGTYRNALSQAGRYQNHHRVYKREAATCPTCGRGRIVRAVQAQRATFFCPRCQPRPRKPR